MSDPKPENTPEGTPPAASGDNPATPPQGSPPEGMKPADPNKEADAKPGDAADAIKAADPTKAADAKPGDKPAETKITAVAPPAKPAPAKPAPTKTEPSRRSVLLAALFSWINIAWLTLTLSLTGMLLWTVRFLFPNVLSEPPSTFKAGAVDDYEEGQVSDKYKEVGAWVILGRDESNRRIIYALSTTCTHLGCTPNWLEGDKKFKCPCHGSGFKISGVNFEGPAPRPLERYAIKNENGQLVVDKARKFQKELGQWEDSSSYVLV